MVSIIVIAICVYLGFKVLKGIFKLFAFIVAVTALVYLLGTFGVIDISGVTNVLESFGG